VVEVRSSGTNVIIFGELVKLTRDENGKRGWSIIAAGFATLSRANVWYINMLK
jgi:hypothetical protein